MPAFLYRPRPRAGGAFGLAILASALVVGPAIAADQEVTIASFAFAPPTVTVNVGDTVTWTNQDSVAHTATATDASWDTGDIGQGASASITFTAAGTFTYLCTPHPTMTGTVVVRAPAGGGGGGGGSPTTPPTDVAVAPAGSSAPAPGMLGLAAIVLGALGAAFIVRRPRRGTLP